jgi:hypothetical protein
MSLNGGPARDLDAGVAVRGRDQVVERRVLVPGREAEGEGGQLLETECGVTCERVTGGQGDEQRVGPHGPEPDGLRDDSGYSPGTGPRHGGFPEP